MLLGIAGYPKREWLTGMLDGRSIGEEPVVKLHHLLNQACRMAMPTLGGCEHLVVLGLIAAQQQYITDTQELQVEQLVLDTLLRGTTADDMRNDRKMIFLLNGKLTHRPGHHTFPDGVFLHI